MTKTPMYAVICPTHGQQGLDEAEYLRQIADETRSWICPVCQQDARWDPTSGIVSESQFTELELADDPLAKDQSEEVISIQDAAAVLQRARQEYSCYIECIYAAYVREDGSVGQEVKRIWYASTDKMLEARPHYEAAGSTLGFETNIVFASRPLLWT